MTGYTPSPLSGQDEDPVQPSLNDWMDSQGTSSRHPDGTHAVSIEVILSKPTCKCQTCCTMCIHMFHCTFPNVSFSPLHILHYLLQSLPEEYQVLLAEHNSLLEKDFDELANTMKEQGKAIMAKRGAELASKFIHLNKRLNDVADMSNKMSHLKKPTNDNVNMHPPPDPTGSAAVSPKKPSNPLESTTHASTSSAPIAPEDSTKGPFPSPPPIAPDVSTKGPVPSSPPIPPADSTKYAVPSPPLILPDESTKGPIPSPLAIPPKDITKDPVPCKPSSPSASYIDPYIDDIPSFDLFQPEDPEYKDVCGERSRSPTPTGKHS
jgi:hypothetical protein